MTSSPTYLSRRYFRDLCDFVLDALDPEPTDPLKAIDLERIDALPGHSLIYLSPKADTELFFRVVFPRIDTPVVLVTGGTGQPNPGRFKRHLAPDWTIESRERRGDLGAEGPGAPRS